MNTIHLQQGVWQLSRKSDQLEIVKEIKIWPYYQMVYAQIRIRPREWDAYDSLGLWDTNGSPNPGQKTRLSVNQQKKENLSSGGFCRSGWSHSKNRIKRKDRQMLGSKQRAKKTVEHDVDGDGGTTNNN